MNGQIGVEYEQGDRFLVRIRDHELVTDQPAESGGGDVGPTPTELFVASLVSCVGFYAERYLRRHDLPSEGLRVTGWFTMADTPARVDAVRIAVELPEGIPDKRRETLLAVVEKCTVHNSLRHAPDVRIEVGTLHPVAARNGREA
jgi:uncharacterized OsmC-like protein